MKPQSKDEVIRAIVNHLHLSPYHNLPAEEAELQAQGEWCIEGRQEEAEEEAPQDPPLPAAELVVGEAAGSAAAASSGAAAPAAANQKQRQQQYPVAAATCRTHRSRSPGGDRSLAPRALAPGSMAPAPAIAASLGEQSSPFALRTVQQTDCVVRGGEMAMILDSIKRAAQSTRQAQRICEQAATSFRMEANALEAAHGHLTMQFVTNQQFRNA